MEVIDLPGYIEDEKFEIGRRYLVARQIGANGLKPEQAEITDEALHAIIRDYTREAGVRNLEREIGTVLRSAAMKIAEGSAALCPHRYRGSARLSWGRAGLRERWRCAPVSPAWQPGLPGLR